MKLFTIKLLISTLALFAAAADNWENRATVALAFAGSEAVIEHAEGTVLPAPLLIISKLVEGDFRLPVWLNRDQASLWLYPTESFRQPLDLQITFAERATGKVPRKPMRLRLTANDRPFKLAIPIKDWPDGEYLTTISALRQDGHDSGALVRLLRRQTLPEPPKPAGPVNVKGLTLPMVDDWYFTTLSTDARHRIHPAELFPVTGGPLKPGRVLQGGSRVRVLDDGTVKITFWDKERDGSDMRRHIATSQDLVRWNISEMADVTQTPAPFLPWIPSEVNLLASFARHLRPALFTATASLRPLPVVLPAVVPQTAPTKRFRFYDAKRDGAVNLSQVSLRWVGLKDTTLGDIPAVRRSTWPIWSKSKNEHLVLLREPPMIDKPGYQAGELDTWRDTNDNFGGQWLNRKRSRLHYCRTRTTVRFPPFRVPYDNMSQVNRILAVWSTTNGLDWQTTWFSQPTEEESIGLQHYGVHTFALENEHLRLGYVYNYNQLTQQIWIELNTSRDGLHWKRAPGRVPLAANGPPGSPTFGMLFSDDREVPHGDHMFRTLNNCSSGVHFYQLTQPPEKITAEYLSQRYATRGLAEKWPFFKEVGGWEDLANAMRNAYKSIVLMRMRRDGWSSLRADGTATATTCVLNAGEALALNARADSDGSITVELLDETGQPLPDYSGVNAARFRGDATRQALTWKAGTVTTLPKNSFRLRLTLQKADCFALYF